MTYYDVLGITEHASQDEIKTAYRNMLKAFHPDYYTGDKQFAEAQTKRIVDAYSVLRDAEKRKEYDRLINAGESRSRSSGENKEPRKERHTDNDKQSAESNNEPPSEGGEDAVHENDKESDDGGKAAFEWFSGIIIALIMTLPQLISLSAQ